jgi:hypothetical protein
MIQVGSRSQSLRSYKKSVLYKMLMSVDVTIF